MDVDDINFSTSEKSKQGCLIREAPDETRALQVVQIQTLYASRLEFTTHRSFGAVERKTQHAIPASHAFQRKVRRDAFRPSKLEREQALNNEGNSNSSFGLSDSRHAFRFPYLQPHRFRTARRHCSHDQEFSAPLRGIYSRVRLSISGDYRVRLSRDRGGVPRSPGRLPITRSIQAAYNLRGIARDYCEF